MTFMEFFQKGGPVVIALVLLSLTALTVAFERLLVYLSVLSDLKNLADRTSSEVKEAAEYNGSIVESWLGRLLQTSNDKDGTPTQFQARFQSLEDTLATRLGALTLMARVAPLMGLLGTVIGLMRAFMAVEASGSQLNPAALAGGIWEALLATCAGLTVAITCWFFHWFLENWLEGMVRTAEHLVVDHPSLFGRLFAKETAGD